MATEEVMVAHGQGLGQKITQAAILLQTQRQVTISAINLAISAAINLAELLKHRVKGLYQINSFEKMQDSTKTRLRIKLSFDPLDIFDKGYQPPIPEDQVTEKSLEDLKKPPARSWKESGDFRPRAQRNLRRRPRPRRENNDDDRENYYETKGNREHYQPRSRPSRYRRGNFDRPDNNDWGYGEEQEKNDYRSRPARRPPRRSRRPRNEYFEDTRSDNEYETSGREPRPNYSKYPGDTDNAFGRSSRGRRPRDFRRPRREYRDLPNWGLS